METKTEPTEAFKNGQRIGYFDHNLRCLVLDGDNFTAKQTWKDWRAFKKAYPREGISEFLFRYVADLKADGNKKGSIEHTAGVIPSPNLIDRDTGSARCFLCQSNCMG